MTKPDIVPERDKTPRQAVFEALTDTPMTALEISGIAGVSEKDVYEHIVHLRRSQKAISMVPATCRKCGYVFAKRERLTKPGRCPKCKERRIAAPRFYLSD